jgi:nitroimidazol reductase NimA-like FMN-containing flavoprotein (pyridoxamine 5'-phosphate oxidase superfamily)
MEAGSSFAVTPRSQVRRSPARASYDRAAAYAILDEALVASVGFSEEGNPFVIPMVYARLDDALVLHAASKSRFAMQLAAGAPLCVTVTLVDGLVLARSAMHHSMNYRSVVAFGRVDELTDEAEKLRALARLVDHVLAGRSLACRPPNALELKATRVFALALDEVSVKRRSGGPLDDAEDLALPYWAGVVPLAARAGVPVPDGAHAPLGPEPPELRPYERRRPDEPAHEAERSATALPRPTEVNP